MYVSHFFIHSTVDGHLGFFQFGVLMNNAVGEVQSRHPKICHFGILIILNQSYLKNSQYKEGHLTLLCHWDSIREISPVKGTLSAPRDKETSLKSEMGIQSAGANINKFCYFY